MAWLHFSTVGGNWLHAINLFAQSMFSYPFKPVVFMTLPLHVITWMTVRLPGSIDQPSEAMYIAITVPWCTLISLSVFSCGF